MRASGRGVANICYAVLDTGFFLCNYAASRLAEALHEVSCGGAGSGDQHVLGLTSPS